MLPLITIIIPTHNRLARLKRVFGALERQEHPLGQFEVVVVSDGSTDGTDEYLRTLETPLRLVPVFQPNQGVAAARNTGVKRASGQLILFLDDDVVPAPQLIAEHLRVHEQHDEDVVVLGPMLTPDDYSMAPWVRWEQAQLYKQYADMQTGRWPATARQFYTGNTSLSRRHILDTGGFDERFRRAEDVELAYRLAERGLRFVFCPEAAGYHYAERSYASWASIPYAYGRNDVIFARDKGQPWLLPVVLREFHQRHPLIRGLVRACVGRSWLCAPATAGLRTIASVGDRIGIEQLPRLTYSGIFNLRYYQGVADELGGREQIFKQMEQFV